MARVSPSIEPQTAEDHTSTVVTIAGVIAALYFGSEILVPIALAVLLSFAMTPAVKLLQKLGLGRGLPVLITVIFTGLLIAGLAGLVAMQIKSLSSDLPLYESTMVRKIEAVKAFGDSGGLRRLEESVAKLTKVAGAPQSAKPDPVPSTAGTAPDARASTAEAKPPAPTPVEIVSPPMRPLDTVKLVAGPLLHPLAMALVVLIFVIFILLQREDLRNRAIRLFGANDLQRSTAAINDGARRLSRYLLTQCAVNAGTGVIVGGVLWLIGVPSPILLGIVFALARFVPYVGPALGAALPLLLALAVDQGWGMVVWTAAALAVIELVIGQLVEPFAYGHNTGLSPIAIVVAATFWTVLWGPVGLFLSTPLTVCLVVLGRHVEKLAFLDVLLGDRPPLSPAETFYQRLLANDPVEAADQAQQCLGTMSVARYYDEVGVPGLLMAQDDATQGRLDTSRQQRIAAAAMEVVDDLDPGDPEPGGEKDEDGKGLFGLGTSQQVKDVSVDDLVAEKAPPALRAPGSVMCIGARGPLDDAAAAMLAHVYVSHGIGAVAESFSRLSKADLPNLDLGGVKLVCLSALDGSSPAFLRFILRRVRRHAPDVDILLGAWWRRDGHRDTDDEIDAAIHYDKAATLVEAVRYSFARARDPEGAVRGDGKRDAPVATLAVAS